LKFTRGKKKETKENDKKVDTNTTTRQRKTNALDEQEKISMNTLSKQVRKMHNKQVK
jgi:hypothetical protein